MVKPPIVLIAGMLRARAPRRHDRFLDVDLRRGRAAPLRAAERRRLGRAALARHRPLPRPLDRGREIARHDAVDAEDRTTTPKETAERGRPQGAAVLGQPDDLRRQDDEGAAALRRAGSSRRDRRLAAGHLPGAAPERAADADRHEPGASDLLSGATRRNIAAATSSPARSSRGARSPRRAAACPSIEPGMPAPAGTGLSRRSFLLRERRARAQRLRREPAEARRPSSRGSPRRPAARARCSSRSSSTAASTRSRCSRRSPTTRTAGCARPCGWRPAPAPTWTEDPRLQWHPSAAPLHQLHGEGKVTVVPGDRLHERRPVPLHLPPLLGGRRAQRPTRTPAGSGACSTSSATTTTRCRASRSTARSRPASRPARVPVAATWGPSYDLWAPGVWGDVEDLMFEASPARRKRREVARRAPQRRRPGRPAGEDAAGAAAGVLGRDRAPVTYPDDGPLLGEPRRRSRRCSTPGCRSRWPRWAPRQLRHPRRAGRGLPQRPRRDLRRAARLPARPRGARARRSGGHVVWSEFGRRPEENGSPAPTTAPAATPS